MLLQKPIYPSLLMHHDGQVTDRVLSGIDAAADLSRTVPHSPCPHSQSYAVTARALLTHAPELHRVPRSLEYDPSPSDPHKPALGVCTAASYMPN